jgi:antitoxin (DNA-binding transcriptional repressor) of toxin-antitoxin stability system
MAQAPQLSRADLGPRAGEVLDAVHQGETVLIDGEGEPEAAVVDLVDHRILRAAIRYYANPSWIELDENGPTDEMMASVEEVQERFDVVMAYYLAQICSLARAGELLGQPWIVMRDRHNRLGLPVWTGPETLEEALEDVRNAEAWAATWRR